MIGLLKNFPRDQKFLLADRIQALTSEVLEIFIEAYYSRGFEKKNRLQQANIKLEKLRYYIRLCYELGFYSSIKYANYSGKNPGYWSNERRMDKIIAIKDAGQDVRLCYQPPPDCFCVQQPTTKGELHGKQCWTIPFAHSIGP